LTQASLNTLAADNVAHGADLQIQAIGPAGSLVTLAEIMAMDYTVDDDVQEVGPMGTRRISVRPGRLKVTGTIKAYWVNQALFSMLQGSGSVSSSGSASIVYASNRPFQRYNIRVSLTAQALAALPNLSSVTPQLFVNVVFDKDLATWDKDKLTDSESIPFHAEDVIYNSA